MIRSSVLCLTLSLNTLYLLHPTLTIHISFFFNKEHFSPIAYAFAASSDWSFFSDMALCHSFIFFRSLLKMSPYPKSLFCLPYIKYQPFFSAPPYLQCNPWLPFFFFFLCVCFFPLTAYFSTWHRKYLFSVPWRQGLVCFVPCPILGA